MDIATWFPHFVRINFPRAANSPNVEIIAIGREFEKYMDDNFDSDLLGRIWPKSISQIILQLDHPLKTNGYEPALVLHFIQWIEKQIKNQEAEQASI